MATGVAGSIYNALALEIKVVFSPAPELVAKVRSTSSVTLGEPSIRRAHIVVQGESLSKIARQCYGDMMLWPLIYDANRSTIGVNPNVIRIGQKLAIPELASFTSIQLEQARRRPLTSFIASSQVSGKNDRQ
jgi:LysM repeat protein